MEWINTNYEDEEENEYGKGVFILLYLLFSSWQLIFVRNKLLLPVRLWGTPDFLPQRVSEIALCCVILVAVVWTVAGVAYSREKVSLNSWQAALCRALQSQVDLLCRWLDYLEVD